MGHPAPRFVLNLLTASVVVLVGIRQCAEPGRLLEWGLRRYESGNLVIVRG